jgi:S1-C subfamily serine protease
MAATFALGGLVGAAGFGLGQRYGDTATETAEPIAQVAEPAAPPEATTTVPGGDVAPDPVGTEPVADVARVLGPSVVQVETNRGQGSGVVYDDRLLLTNHHVVEGASQVRIRTADGRVVDVDVLGSDPRNDIAVLGSPQGGLPVATIGSSAALEVGQLTVAIGSPFQLQQTVTSGIVSSVNRPVPNAAGGITAMIQTDAPINPGNSGGALANRSGELVGINAAIRTDGISNSNVGIGFAVPIDTAIRVADRIVAGESLEPGALGVTGDRQDEGIGVPVAEVVPDSGAAAAGLQSGDRVLTVDGAPVTNIGELVGLIQSNFRGDTVELEVQRGGSIRTFDVTLT